MWMGKNPEEKRKERYVDGENKEESKGGDYRKIDNGNSGEDMKGKNKEVDIINKIKSKKKRLRNEKKKNNYM